MDNAVPSALTGRWLIGPIAAIAEDVRHEVEDMPQKRFRKDEAICTLVNDDHNIEGLGGINTVAYDTNLSNPRILRSQHTHNKSCA